MLARYAKTRDPRALDELVVRFMPLARKLASRYHGGRESSEDLLQVASVGLVNAIHRFDPDRGVSFAGFAAPTILGELRRHFRDRGWAVRVPRQLQEQNLAVEKALEELPSRLGRSPTIAEIAEHTKLDVERVLEAIEAGNAHHADSIDRQKRSDDGESRSAVETIGSVDPGYEMVEYGASIAPALAKLSDRDRWILQMRFVEDMTQSEIADVIGVSQMQISRILRSALSAIRKSASS